MGEITSMVCRNMYWRYVGWLFALVLFLGSCITIAVWQCHSLVSHRHWVNRWLTRLKEQKHSHKASSVGYIWRDQLINWFDSSSRDFHKGIRFDRLHWKQGSLIASLSVRSLTDLSNGLRRWNRMHSAMPVHLDWFRARERGGVVRVSFRWLD